MIKTKRHNTGLIRLRFIPRTRDLAFVSAWQSIVLALTSDSAAGHRHFRGIHRRHDSLWAELH